MLNYCSNITERVLYSTIKNVMNGIFTNFEKEQLSASLLKGNVEIRNLNIKSELFENISFPIRLSDGIVGKVKMEIVWRKIFTQEFLKIRVEDVYIIFNTIDMKLWNVEMFEKDWMNLKGKLLKKDEFLMFLKSSIASNFLRQIGHFFISKIQIEIKNVNFRIENTLRQYLQRFAIGLSIDTISSRNCNEYWIPIDNNNNDNNTKKRMSFEMNKNELDEENINLIIDKYFNYINSDNKLDNENIDNEELVYVLSNIIDRSRSITSLDKHMSNHDFWSKLRNKTPLKWVWNMNKTKDNDIEKNYSDIIFPYPNGFGIIKNIVDNYIVIKENKEVERYKREKLVNNNILIKNDVFLKSFIIDNFSIYVDEISHINNKINNHLIWSNNDILENKEEFGSKEIIVNRINYLNEISNRESKAHNYIIYPQKFELRIRLTPSITKYNDNIYASALNDRFYISSQDKDNQIIPLISFYLIIDNLNLDFTENQLRILLEFIDYSIFLYGDFATGSCPAYFRNFPDDDICIKYRLSWFDFLIGNKDRNSFDICDIEDKYNAYSLIKLRNDVVKYLNYSIYHSIIYYKNMKNKNVDCHKSIDIYEFSILSDKIIENDDEVANKYQDMDQYINQDLNQKLMSNYNIKLEKINTGILQYILSKIVIGQSDHYSLSLNINQDQEINTKKNTSDIYITDEELKLIEDNNLINNIIINTKKILSDNELQSQINNFDINSYLKSEDNENNQVSHHTSLFSLIFNVQNLSLNYSINSDNDFLLKKTLRFNCMDLYFQYKHYIESKKSELTIALENCYIINDDNNNNSNSNCLLRIGPNIQTCYSDFENLIYHPILHRSSIYTGTTICNKRPYRTSTYEQKNSFDICECIGGLWFVISLNNNPFRVTPKISINGKTYGEISLIGSYDVLQDFLDPIINHLSPKQRNTYLNKASKNIIRVIKKGQKFMNEFFSNNGLNNLYNQQTPNYIYVNIEAKARQLLFLPVLKTDYLNIKQNNLNSNFIKAINKFSDLMEYKIRSSNKQSMYCLDFGDLFIETVKLSKITKIQLQNDKCFIDKIKLFASNISLSFINKVRLVDLYICKDDSDNYDYSRIILKPQNWIFTIVKYMNSSINKVDETREYSINFEFSLKLREETSVEINTTDMDLHNIAEIINYFMNFYSQYNIINYSQILVNNMEENQTNIESSLESIDSILAYSNSKIENIKFSTYIKFLCVIPDTRILISSDSLYREKIGMSIKDLPVIKLIVSSVKVLISNGEQNNSTIYVSIGDVCLSGGISNRNKYLLVPLFYPISDTFCNLSIKFSDLRNIDRFKDFTGILLSNTFIAVHINNPRFIVYWELYGIILNWFITFYFKSIAIHLERKIEINNIKSIFNMDLNDKNIDFEDEENRLEDKNQSKLNLDQSKSEKQDVNQDKVIQANQNKYIQLLSIINIKIYFKNVVAMLPCTLSDPIQMIITENDSLTYRVDILKSILAIIGCDITYSFFGESIFEIENAKNSVSKLKNNSMKSTFELFKGNIQFGKSITPKYILELLNKISRNHLNRTNIHVSNFGVTHFGSGITSLSNYSQLKENIHNRDFYFNRQGQNVTNILRSFYISKSDFDNNTIVELENIVNSYQWQYNIDYINNDNTKIISSLRFKIDYINHQIDVKSNNENVILLYGYIETVEIKINTNDLLHLINIVDLYYKNIQNNLFIDLNQNNQQNMENQDSNIDLNSDYSSSKYNIGYNNQVNNSKNTSYLNYLLYLYPSIFYTIVSSYTKFISQLKIQGIKIHYIPTNLSSNKDGVLIDIKETQFGLFINNSSPLNDYLMIIFPFLKIFNENSTKLIDEYEIKDKQLMIPYFSLNSIPILPVLPQSKDTFFGWILEFKKISVSIFNNQLMFYDNFIEPFDIDLSSVCKGKNINISKITKEKVIPKCIIEITWINLTLTPEYVKYWLNCLDNFNEVYTNYYNKLNNRNKLINKRLFLYNEYKSKYNSDNNKLIKDTKLLSSRPLSGDYEEHIININNKQLMDNKINNSDFIFYNDTGQTIAILMPCFINNNQINITEMFNNKQESINTELLEDLNNNRKKSEKVNEKSYKESIFDKLLIKKRSINTRKMTSQDSEFSNISNVSKASYSLHYVWRYLKPNNKISLNRDEYGNIYPIVIRIRIINDVFDLHNITVDKVNMEVVYLNLTFNSIVKIPILVRTDIMDNHSFLISISSRVYITNKTSNILRFLPNFKNVEQFLNHNYFIPPISNNPILISKNNSKYYETISRKYIDQNYIMSVLDEEIKKGDDYYSDYLSIFFNSNNINKNINIDMFTLYLNPNTYACMPMWISIPVLNATNKQEIKYYPLRVILNNIWLDLINNDIYKNISIDFDKKNEDQEVLVNEMIKCGELLVENYKRIYIELIDISQAITPLKSYKRLLSSTTFTRKKNFFDSIMIQLNKRLINGNYYNTKDNEYNLIDETYNNYMSLCSSICDYTLSNSKNLNSLLFVIKLEIPLIIKNNLLIPIQISFNKEKEKYKKTSGSIEQINSSKEIINFKKDDKDQDNNVQNEDDDDNLNILINKLLALNDSNKGYIQIKNNERILIESLPSNLNLSLLDISFNKFFGFYRSSQIPINYNSSGKEIHREHLIPLKFYNGYKLLPGNELVKINNLSTVLVNEFLPNSSCISVVFEKNKTFYTSRDFIPRQKQNFNYYMDDLLNFESNNDNMECQKSNVNYAISTPWYGYQCNSYNTCKIRINIYSPLWINNRQHIPIYVLQKSHLSSKYRVGSNEYRILPTSNGKTDLSIALTPELSKKFRSNFFHIERANVVGTIIVPSRKTSSILFNVNNNHHYHNHQNLLFKDVFSTNNIGLKLGYCVTTINNFSSSPNFMINIYNKYNIVNYHNVPLWIRESSKIGNWIYIPANISIPFHPLDSKELSIVEVTFLDPKIIDEYESKYKINLKNIPYKTLPLSIDNLYDIQVRLISSLDNIPNIVKSKNSENNELGNIHFTYILSSISIYSINSSTSYQINIYPSQIPDFCIVNETPCNIFVKQLNTNCWNSIGPISDSNYALLDPFGDHILELVVGINSNNLEFANKIKTKKSIHSKADQNTNHNLNNHHYESLVFNDYGTIPDFIYSDCEINKWYKLKGNLNLNKVLTHTKLYLPEYNNLIYIVILIENGTRVINISFDNTLYKRRRNEVRAINHNYLVNKNKNEFSTNNQENENCLTEDNSYNMNCSSNHAISKLKSLGIKLRHSIKYRNKDTFLIFDDNSDDDLEECVDNNNAIHDYKEKFENNQISDNHHISENIKETNIENISKTHFLPSFETELSQMSNSNLSRVSSGQNLFLLIDNIKPETRICFELKINCNGLGVSFLSGVNKEITYMSFQKINLKVEKSTINSDQFHLGFRIMEFQLDNHITTSAENTIIRKATPNEFLRLSKLKNRKKENYYSQLIKKTELHTNDDNKHDIPDELEEYCYYGIESLLSVGVATLGEGTKRKSEIMRIHNKLLEYMISGSHNKFDISNREKKIKSLLSMESFLDIQYSIVIDNNNDISAKYGSNGVVEMPYLYFWMYPLSIHLDIDTLRQMVSILELLINRILSPTEELDTTRVMSLESLPLIENLKTVSKYVYIQVLIMNPIQILCSTSKSTWNIVTSQNNNFTDYYNIMNNLSKIKENELIVKDIIPLFNINKESNDVNELQTFLNYRILNNFDDSSNLNNELGVNQENVIINNNSHNNGKNHNNRNNNDNNNDVNENENNDNNEDKNINQAQIQNNLTTNKTGTEFLLNILQWLSTMPFSNVPIEFKGIINESMFMDSEKCVAQIGDLYKQQIFSHIGKIIGSIDLIGNPIDIYILLKEGLLASKYHFDLYKRAYKLKEKINENLQRKRMKIKEKDLDIDNNYNFEVDRFSLNSKNDENFQKKTLFKNEDNEHQNDINDILSLENTQNQYQSVLDFCYDIEESYLSKTYDEEVEIFLKENKSLVLKSNAELMTKIVLFSIKEIILGLHILLGTGIAIVSQVIVRITSTTIHLLEVTYLLDQDCLMGYWYGTPLYMNRYLADNPSNLIDGFLKGFLRSFLIIMSIIINFWQLPKKMKNQIGLPGIFLGILISIIRIVPAGFSAFISIFYGISSGVVQSLRTKIKTKHVRTLRIVYNDSPILPYNSKQSIATIILNSLKLITDVKESKVVTYIPFNNNNNNNIDNNIDNIIKKKNNINHSSTDDGIEKKFLIYKLLVTREDSSLNKHNGLIILKESIALLKSGKILWMIPLININRINLYVVLNNIKLDENNSKMRRKKIKNVFNHEKSKIDDSFNIENQFLDIMKNFNHENALFEDIDNCYVKKTFEFHLFIKPDTINTFETPNTKYSIIQSSFKNNHFGYNNKNRGINTYSNKKYIRQLLLPKKVNNIQIEKRFTINDNKYVNIITNNKTINDAFKSKNNKKTTFDTRNSSILSSHSSSHNSSIAHFPLSSFKQFTEKISFIVEDRSDAMKIFSLLSKYINSE